LSAVNTSSDIVRNSMDICNGVIQMLSTSCKEMQRKYMDAGKDWNDSEYRQLGDIVNECDLSINKAIRELNSCLEALDKITVAVEEYESTNISENLPNTTNNTSVIFYGTSSINGTYRLPIKNKVEGLRREMQVKEELLRLYPESEGYVIINEAPLRNEDGLRARDPITNEGRRIDFVINIDGRIIDMIEVTSQTADKTEQIDKEIRIRNAGGNYLRINDEYLVRIPDDVQTRIERRN